jgi:CelD/BcsL family acetyltransferase involved in cellulose biosynthesis
VRDNITLKLKVYDQLDVFDALRKEWNPLVLRSTSNRIFGTWEWNSTWWRAYLPGELLVVTCHNEDDLLVGLAPWFVSAADGALAIIGCKEVTDYLDLIVDQNYIKPVLEAFANFLATSTNRFRRIEFCNVPEDSLTCTILPEMLKACGFEIRLEREDVCPIIPLPADWAAYLGQLDKKNRHELRRKLRRTHGSNVEVDWYIVDDEHDLTAEMETFLQMMAASDTSKAVFLSDPQNAAFFRAIAPVLYHMGWLQLSFLTVNGARAAAYLNFDYNNEILVYNSGIYSDQYGYLSPGIVLLANNIQHAIETGHTAFDFLQGDEEYKYRMGGQDKVVFNLIAEYVG